MPKIKLIEHDGTEHEIDGEVGKSLMRNAVDNNVPGIDADCGGECACATCHVFVDDEWLPRTGAPSEEETRLLGFAATLQPNSRLSCQILLDETLNGLVVRLPEAQH
ncbi:2Fe-2S iron-sulfur cluster-binding protein [Bradyrhizobium sp. LHD-71]|uniref:2Fe-2S iron-sulfur cluster-binding protein n=1 Tax=Bradyrhizobium sp. LHD-71 TaxID=3072141 RepID=UPI00280E9C57|nr:2Fe-2S iron-sulfur cluster-binding protein [Bradyrhizobium sp. LHD-71]MDQ8726231.1 2Fe-2S iron-sulfur cluster-binding protein [Bradyrhizobium sp. LHD-71]